MHASSGFRPPLVWTPNHVKISLTCLWAGLLTAAPGRAVVLRVCENNDLPVLSPLGPTLPAAVVVTRQLGLLHAPLLEDRASWLCSDGE